MGLYNKIKELGKSNKLVGEKLTIFNKDGSFSIFSIMMTDSMRLEDEINSINLQIVALDINRAMQTSSQRKYLFDFFEKVNTKSINPFIVFTSCIYDKNWMRKLPLIYVNIKVEKESNKIVKFDIVNISDCFSSNYFSNSNCNWNDYQKSPSLSCLYSIIKILSQNLEDRFLEEIKQYLLNSEYKSINLFKSGFYKFLKNNNPAQKIKDNTLEKNENYDIINNENE